jgi:GAF domain-containing protein
VVGRVLLSRAVIQIEDVLADPEYTQDVAQRLASFRTLMGVPITLDGEIVGVINVGRSEVRPFDEGEIAIVGMFGEQVAVAIGNARPYGAVGNAVILASQLSNEAAAGQILLDQRTYAAIEDRVTAEPVGELSLKGISRPVAAFGVVSLR